MSHPKARTDVAVEPIHDDLLIFDPDEGRAHSVNAPVRKVWEACDGTRDQQALAAHTGLDVKVVDLALEQLRNTGLLENSEALPLTPAISRRAALRKVAVTGAAIGVAIPVIRSITAPTAALAASTCVATLNSGNPCTATCQCRPVYGSPACCCDLPANFTQCVTANGCAAQLGTCRP